MAEETAGTRGSGQTDAGRARQSRPETRGQGLRACGALGWVALGGAAGTLVRAVVAVDVPRTLLVNVVGAFLLGLLLGHLAQVEQTPGRRRLRLLAGTGFTGGLTTYSTFVLQVDCMGWAGVGYAALSLGAGLVAAGVGLAVARRTA